MKVEESLVVLPPVQSTKRRQAYYLPAKQPDGSKQQLRIEDFLLKKKKRLNENAELIGSCAKRAKMLLNPFNKFSNYYLFDSTDHHCASHGAKIAGSKMVSNKLANNGGSLVAGKINGNSLSNNLNASNLKINKINNQTNINNQNKSKHLEHHANQHSVIAGHHPALLFNRKTNLPLSSSPIPQHKSPFSFERSIKSTNAIQRAVLNKEPETDENFNLVVKKTPNKTPLFKNLLGNFEVGAFCN